MSKSAHINTPVAGQHGFQKTHGLSKSPEYGVWNGMKNRCHNADFSGYYKYGARGIVVCDEWRESFAAFYRDMGPRPSPKHSIERADNDGPYAPWNCHWDTLDRQANNKRSTILIGGKKIADIAAETGLKPSTIRARHYQGNGDRAGSISTLRRRDADTMNKGSTNGQAKLAEDDVRAIRALRDGGMQMKDIASQFGVSISLISSICTGKRWSWLA